MQISSLEYGTTLIFLLFFLININMEKEGCQIIDRLKQNEFQNNKIDFINGLCTSVIYIFVS